jgi:hypothetical protein
VLDCTVVVGVTGGVLKSVVDELISLCNVVLDVNCEIVDSSSKLEVSEVIISVVISETLIVERSGVTGGVGISLVVVLEIVDGLLVVLDAGGCGSILEFKIDMKKFNNSDFFMIGIRDHS